MPPLGVRAPGRRGNTRLGSQPTVPAVCPADLYHPSRMELSLVEALGLGQTDVVAFVGAGGKTSAMYRLARELSARGERVVVCTTTKILPPPPADDLQLVLHATRHGLLEAAQACLESGRIPVAGRGITSPGKVDGIPVEWVDALWHLPGVRFVVVEADGAARRPMTAPRAHEPVIPPAATLVVPVVGAEVLGQPLSGDLVHNPERIAALTGLAIGEPLDPAAVATVLMAAEGNVRGRPRTARIVPMVNKVDLPSRLAAARAVAEELRRRGAERVILGAVGTERPVVDVIRAS